MRKVFIFLYLGSFPFRKCFAWDCAWDLSGGLGTASFVIVTNFTPNFRMGKFYRENSWQVLLRVNELRKRLDIGQHDVLETFTVKRSTISDIIIELVNDIFEEIDWSSPIKNTIDILNLLELEVDDISATFVCRKYEEKYTNKANHVFSVFSERIGRGDIKTILTADSTCLLLRFVR